MGLSIFVQESNHLIAWHILRLIKHELSDQVYILGEDDTIGINDTLVLNYNKNSLRSNEILDKAEQSSVKIIVLSTTRKLHAPEKWRKFFWLEKPFLDSYFLKLILKLKDN